MQSPASRSSACVTKRKLVAAALSEAQRQKQRLVQRVPAAETPVSSALDTAVPAAERVLPPGHADDTSAPSAPADVTSRVSASVPAAPPTVTTTIVLNPFGAPSAPSQPMSASAPAQAPLAEGLDSAEMPSTAQLAATSSLPTTSTVSTRGVPVSRVRTTGVKPRRRRHARAALSPANEV
ncbi:hypothetical protein PF008_g21420 [Phytophthora fragariae]|uniref:Uncharacterized protein n=1 Tax=Phytophthora fragariae TaxID=53985 RepID=A0A6G0QWM9_9STRA|nr:hypothetical protein PF008_g21420 [Phytophthora fragariae]